jgi:hypothetical protein
MERTQDYRAFARLKGSLGFPCVPQVTVSYDAAEHGQARPRTEATL